MQRTCTRSGTSWLGRLSLASVLEPINCRDSRQNLIGLYYVCSRRTERRSRTHAPRVRSPKGHFDVFNVISYLMYRGTRHKQKVHPGPSAAEQPPPCHLGGCGLPTLTPKRSHETDLPGVRWQSSTGGRLGGRRFKFPSACFLILQSQVSVTLRLRCLVMGVKSSRVSCTNYADSAASACPGSGIFGTCLAACRPCAEPV